MLDEELVIRLEAQGTGTFGTDLFAGLGAEVPADRGSLIVVATGGPAPLRTQNSIAVPAYLESMAQLTARDTDTRKAGRRIRRAYGALVNVRNVWLPGLPVTAASWAKVGTTVTLTFAEEHGFYGLQRGLVSFPAHPSFDAEFTATAPSDTTVEFSVASMPAAGAEVIFTPYVWYREIDAVQEPFSMPADVNGLARWAFNVRAVKRPS